MERVGEKRVREEEGGSEREKRSVTEFDSSDVTASVDSLPDAGAAPVKGQSIGERERRIAEAFQTVLEQLDEDPSREGLRKTPARFAKALLDCTEGYREDMQSVVGDAEFSENHKEIVFLSNIETFSLCEHHVVPFFGKVAICTSVNSRCAGLSGGVPVLKVSPGGEAAVRQPACGWVAPGSKF